MKFLKHIVFILLVPIFTNGQTAHVDEERILYKGAVKIENVKKDELYARAKHALSNELKGSTEKIIADNPDKGKIVSKGKIKLASPVHQKKTLEYVLVISVDDGKYQYLIDSVYLKQVEGGEKTKIMPSAKILEGMEESGLVSEKTEKQLNEIDMHFQKLLALLRREMKHGGRN